MVLIFVADVANGLLFKAWIIYMSYINNLQELVEQNEYKVIGL